MNRPKIFSARAAAAVFAAFLFALTTRAGAQRVSVDAANRQAKGDSTRPAISADGRYVAFTSNARLLPADKNSRSDVYFKDRTTGELRLVSDERGGDQVSMSADGRFVCFRALYDLPRVRLWDRDGVRETITVSYPFGANNSNRPADNGVISPDGGFIAYVFRPSPNNDNNRDTRIVLYDVFLDDQFQVINGLSDVGRLAITADGEQVFFETTDSLDGSDTNGQRDIYLNDEYQGGNNSSLWISRPGAGGNGDGASTSPAATLDSGRVFFLSTAALTTTDADERASVYRAAVNGSAVTLEHVPTNQIPESISLQASPRNLFLGYSPRPPRSFTRTIIRNLATGAESAIQPLPNNGTSAPAITGDDARMAFFTPASNVAPGDSNGTIDVFVLRTPGGPVPRALPVVTLAGAPLSPVTEFSNITLSASATSAEGTIRQTALDRDGTQVFTTVNAATGNRNFSLARGIYRFEARTRDDAWITAKSEPATVIVLPANGQLGITGTVSLVKTRLADGSTQFTARLRIDNRRNTASAALRLIVSEASTPTTMGPIFGDESLVPDRGQNLITTVDVPALAALSTAEIELSGIVSAPELFVEGFQGNGWIATAALQELSGANFNFIDSRDLFSVAPLLEEDTPGPNGGVPQFGTPNGTSNFNPPTLTSISITGPATVNELTSATFRAVANFSNATTKPITPVWTLGAATGIATINAAGVLSALDVPATRTIQVNAAFNGKNAQVNVSIRPVTPSVSIALSDKIANESGDAGQFKVTRSPVTAQALDLTYEITGTAQNGVDYTQLTGTVTIPASTSRVFIDVAPTNDANFEGLETITLRLLPSSTHRLGRLRSATLNLADDEPFPAGQPDVTIRAGRAKPVGLDVIDSFIFHPQDPAVQSVSARAVRDRATSLKCAIINRGDAPRDFTIFGAVEAAGFRVQYFNGTQDVTAAVVAQTFVFNDVPVGSAVQLTIKVTPTRDAAVGSKFRGEFRAASETGAADSVQFIVERVR